MSEEVLEFLANDCDTERWVKVKDPEILKKVDINYPDSCMYTNWLAEVRDIDENGELFESSPARYILQKASVEKCLVFSQTYEYAQVNITIYYIFQKH